MPSTKWAWDAQIARYRSKKSGRFMSPTTDAKIRDDFNRRRLKDVDALSRKLAKETISVQEWERSMQQVLEKHWTVQYMHGRGGRNVMTPEDRVELRSLIRQQFDYLRGFTLDVRDGRLSDKQIKARAHLYLNDSTRAHSLGRSNAHGVRLPAHPGDGSTACKANCVIEGTLVSADGIKKGYRRWYSGEVLTLTTSQGCVLTVTPNHPVLTGRGWIAAKSLNLGDECRSINHGIRAGNPDIQHQPVSVEQVFQALSVSGRPRERVMGISGQFHGDVAYSDVDVVGTNGKLLDVADTSGIEREAEDIFPDAGHLVLARHLCPSASGEYAIAISHAAPGCVSVTDQHLSFLCGHELESLRVRLGASAWLDSVLQQVSADVSSTDTEPYTESLFALPANVQADTLVEITRSQWSGHVYNLETDNGWYYAGGIIVHNCRCHWEIVDRETEFACTWRKQPSENCPDCKRRARTWAPLVIAKQRSRQARLYRRVA